MKAAHPSIHMFCYVSCLSNVYGIGVNSSWNIDPLQTPRNKADHLYVDQSSKFTWCGKLCGHNSLVSEALLMCDLVSKQQ